VNRCQDNPCAQCNSNPHCAVGFALTLTCWRAQLDPQKERGRSDTRRHLQATRVAPASARAYPIAFSALRTNQWLPAPPHSL
jgi:hypothetical protein